MVELRPPIEPERQRVGVTAHPTLSACAVAIALFASTHSGARDYASRDIGGWTVAASKDGEGCFLTRTYDRPRGTTLLLGLEVDGTNHLTVLNANWSIKPKERLALTFRLSNASFPKHFAVGMASDGKQGFVSSFGEKFPAHFAASRDLLILRGEVPVERLNLEASGVAVAELRKCVGAQRAKPADGASDKGSSDGIPIDPFAPAAERTRRR